MSEFNPFALPADIETTSAQGRLPDRTYHPVGSIDIRASQDHGEPANFVYKVFDNEEETELRLDGESWVVSARPRAGGISQVLRAGRTGMEFSTSGYVLGELCGGGCSDVSDELPALRYRGPFGRSDGHHRRLRRTRNECLRRCIETPATR